MLPELASILNLLEGGFAQLKVLVIGDLMLDRYILGEVDRISPEAPVPILRHAQRYERAGGASNVAMNLAGLGCQAIHNDPVLSSWDKPAPNAKAPLLANYAKLANDADK